MKKIVVLVIGLVILIGCTKNNVEPVNEQNYIPPELIGKWKIYEVYYTDGAMGYWKPYNSGNEYDIWFKSNGSFSHFSVICEFCKYVVTNERYIYFYPNGDPNDPAKIKLLTSEYLILWWTSYEGAGNKYQKISD